MEAFKYLKDNQYYIDLYDKFTIERCRSGERMVNDTFKEMEKDVSVKEITDHHAGWYLHYSIFYFQLVESVAVQRQERCQKAIDEWMNRDSKKDSRLESAQLTKPPYCRNCGKDTVLIHKDYMSRECTDSPESEDGILFMFECKYCNKRLAFWQDGTEWEGSKAYCEKCNTVMDSKDEKNDKMITTTYICPKCGYKYNVALDLSRTITEKDPVDPFYELDRKRFCLDEARVNKIKQKSLQLDRMKNLYIKQIDQSENSHIYDAVKEIEKLKIAQLTDVLRPVIDKESYKEFKLGEPQFEREVTITFSCLDSKSEREEYDSKKDLQKVIVKTLEDTNWRLMSDGVDYRLGYLNGRLRAYETEEDLQKLVGQQFKDGIRKKRESAPQFEPKKLDLREAIQVYLQNITVKGEPVNNGGRRPDTLTTLKSEFHNDLRVIIPARNNDESVPVFVRNFDFIMMNKFLRSDGRTKKKK